jgi:hypothetical protein
MSCLSAPEMNNSEIAAFTGAHETEAEKGRPWVRGE